MCVQEGTSVEEILEHAECERVERGTLATATAALVAGCARDGQELRRISSNTDPATRAS